MICEFCTAELNSWTAADHDQTCSAQFYELQQANGMRRIDLWAVVEMLNSKGPVEIARDLEVSRPTGNKIIEKAKALVGMKATDGVRKAGLKPKEKATLRAILQAIVRGESDNSVFRRMGVGYKQGQKLMLMARQIGTTAVTISPNALDVVFSSTMDALREIAQSAENLQAVSDLVAARMKELDETTGHDLSFVGEGGILHDGYHKRQANIIACMEALRKLEGERRKTIESHGRMMDRFLDLEELKKNLECYREGIRDTLATWVAGGRLDLTLEDASDQIAKTIRARLAAKKGIV
jgi:hypothetical protein